VMFSDYMPGPPFMLSHRMSGTLRVKRDPPLPLRRPPPFSMSPHKSQPIKNPQQPSPLLTNHNQMVMVSCVKPANTNHVFRALADPTRRAIFEELTRRGEQTVHALTHYAGVSQPAVSKHLAVLKRAKLVRHRREGRETHYRAQADALAPMVDWLRDYGAFWRDRFDQLETLLERMEQ
jgi:DNA-binding transcriptional ArsR family regulator